MVSSGKQNGLFFLVCFLVGFFSSFSVIPFVYTNRYSLMEYSAVRHMMPLYRSLRKVSDIFFIPYYSFYGSKLEKIELDISPSDIEKMNEALPQNPLFNSGILLTDNKLWVSGTFKSGSYVSKVKVRYRGNIVNHWNSYKKSYLIKFPKDNLYKGMREVVLVIPSDRIYFAMSLNNYRAEKIGMIVLDEWYVLMDLNGAEHGVYLAFEHWSQEQIEKKPVSPLSELYGFDESSNDDFGGDMFLNTAFYRWKSWNALDESYEPLKTLIELCENATSEEFEKNIGSILDLDSFYKFYTLSILSGDYHGYWGNLILFFDATIGRFKVIPYNLTINTKGMGFKYDIGLLNHRILSIPQFKEKRDEFIHKYVEKNKEDDIIFVNNLAKEMRSEFLSDNAKAGNNFMYLSAINQMLKDVEYRLNTYDQHLDEDYTYSVFRKRDVIYPKGFKYLNNVAITKENFVQKNPQFYISGNSIKLSSGIHYFNETVIIPQNTTLVISPNTTLVFGRDVSLISYSPVELKGRKEAPITVVGIKSGEPWGVFAVSNTKGYENIIDYVNFSGGGEDKVNGVVYSGMLALHNANGIVKNSTFRNAFGDDGLNVKGGSVIIENNTFTKNSSDGVDIDYPKENTIIVNNIFKNNRGDAIDVSWSDIVIENNTISNCGDKGISVGERSNPTIANNTVNNCITGIAVKDQSKAKVFENTITDNHTAISLYQKKSFFGGAVAEVWGNVFLGNGNDYLTDSLSTYTELKEK